MGKVGQKKIHLDILRVLAIFGVLFTHSDKFGIYHFLETDHPINFWFGLGCATLTQFCVPMFFMISGALLLKRDESLSYVYKYRVLRIFLVIAILAIITLLENHFSYPEECNMFLWWVQIMFEGVLPPQYWFLYEYLCFLLILPFLQRMAKAIPEKSWYIYIYFMFFFFSCICPIISRELEWKAVNVDLKIFAGCIFYSFMGYFIENVSEDMFHKGKNVLILFALTAIMFAENLRRNCENLSVSSVASNSGVYAPFYAIFLFVLVKYLCYKFTLPRTVQKVFAFASAGVFGTYLMEQVLREAFAPIYVVLNTRIKSYPATFVWLFACLVVGVTLSNLIKKIPVVGKLL